MAKGGAKPAVSVRPLKTMAAAEGESLLQNSFTSSKGVEIPLRPVSQFKIDAMRSSREEVPVPTYTADVFGGGKEELPLDEVAAQNQNRMEEWQAYLTAAQKERSEFGIRMNNMVIYEGVDLDAPGPDSDWQKSCDLFGLKVPTDPIARKIFYINTELLGTSEDMGNLMTAVFAASRFSREVIDKMKATFRSAMERKTDQEVAKDPGPVENK